MSRTPSGERRISFRYSVAEIVLLAVLGVVFGVANVFFGALPQWGGALLGPLFAGLLGGFVQISQVLGGYIVRRPLAATLTMMINVTTQFLAGNPAGIILFPFGAAQGLGAEVVFASTLYRNFTLPIMLLAGGMASVGSQLMFIVFFRWDPTTGPYIASVGIALVAGIIEAGLPAWLLAKGLERTGLIANIMRQSA
ncbi:MAG: ECF transporter S component [Chloroflexi bacterium]|nr:ECF transporter S component [Chloroflexota bacterium]